MPTLSQGILISIEGIDGSGKSTLAHNLFKSLDDLQFSVLLTKEPGGTPLGKKIREIVQYTYFQLDTKAEFLLFAADRAQHFKEIIIPAYANKKIIISDRMADSSLVYQGYGRGLNIETIQQINEWVMEKQKPDITFYVKIDAATAFNRLLKRGESFTIFEQNRHEFTQKLINGFNTIFQNNLCCVELDGTRTTTELTHDAIKFILTWIHKNQLL